VIWHLLITIGIFGILALSLNLAVGRAGLFNLGHAAFFAIGAYTSALLIMKLHWPWLLGLAAAAVLAAVFGYLIGLLTLKLSGDYFAIATLGFAFIVKTVLGNWIDLTRGPMGIPGIPRPNLFGWRLGSLPLQFMLVALCLVGVWFLLRRLDVSPWGRLVRAVRDDEIAARALGKPVLRVKVQAATLSALFAGAAGSLHASYYSFIAPNMFDVDLMIYILVAVIFGGLGNSLGALLGVTLLTTMQQALVWLNVPAALAGSLQQILYSLLLIGMMIFRPKGLIPEQVLRTMGGGRRAAS
jgi:branched-chain amino acid transport system permease protein